MSSVFSVETVQNKRFDRAMLLAVVLLAGVGLAMLFSVSYSRADTLFRNPFYFVQRQSLLMLVGLIGALILSGVNLKTVERFVPFALAGNIVLLLLTFVPQLGASYLGARRWIVLLGFSFQPSELLKLTMVMYLGFLLGRKQDRFDDAVNTLLPPVLMTFLLVGLVYLQNDFSTAVLLLVIAATMFFVAGVRIRYFVSLVIIGLPLLTLLVLSREHRVNRILSFLEPGIDPRGAGYQVLMSQNALRAGGFWGQGIGMGRYKFGILPEAHSDFLFAIVGEELGFVGIFLVLVLFLYLGYRGFLVARNAETGFVRISAFGLSCALIFQALLNMAVVAGAVPATGVTLPFFSSGGTSAMVSVWICGMLLGLSRHVPRDAAGTGRILKGGALG
ncbi:MAG: putative lipid II flippase FtsW [Spirochaetaceae bacterium]|nr:MAG: putative lipid II flippase FtsW [Spirochaetaceae bacterium]